LLSYSSSLESGYLLRRIRGFFGSDDSTCLVGAG
jgi:hypothetical protein